MPVQSDLQTSEWYSYFENDVLVLIEESSVSILRMPDSKKESFKAVSSLMTSL